MKKILFVAASILLAGNAFGAGIKDKKRWAGAEKDVNEVKAKAETACGTKMRFSFDKKSFNPEELDKVSMSGYCGDAFTAMADLCSDADYKAAMKKVKGLTCKYNKTLTKAAPVMKNGMLTFTFNWKTANHQDVVKEYLENSL